MKLKIILTPAFWAPVIFGLIASLTTSCSTCCQRCQHVGSASNTLTAQEKAGGWKLLWDGKTGNGWRSAKSDQFPDHGWTIHDGVLTVHENGGEESAGGGDIITRQRYANFELTADFKIT